jgi:hypothetical protein
MALLYMISKRLIGIDGIGVIERALYFGLDFGMSSASNSDIYIRV